VDTEHLTGSLLIATPVMRDPNFAASVVLVCAHDADGAVGLVLDRPTDVPIADHLPEWRARAAHPAVVFIGGPVQPDVAVVLGEGDAAVPGWSPIVGTTGVLDLATAHPAGPGRVRVFSGYAGWAGGQLEAEVKALDWVVVGAHPDDALDPEPADLWQRALDRKGGLYRAYGQYPMDPAAN